MEWQKSKYDQEERTAVFAERVRDSCLKLPGNTINAEYVSQLIRAGSSPGANDIEANESIGDKDFKMKIKTCRREAKESAYWLRLVMTGFSSEIENEKLGLRQEAIELVLIFSAVLKKRGD
ncbi:MAG TPA: four helix bundle protein [Agriterribacter sp.]|nr:four helix bundle protein [Agriterribacter sp.]